MKNNETWQKAPNCQKRTMMSKCYCVRSAEHRDFAAQLNNGLNVKIKQDRSFFPVPLYVFKWWRNFGHFVDGPLCSIDRLVKEGLQGNMSGL